MRRRGVLVPLVGAELLFHVLGVLEVHLTWWLIQGAAPPLLTSFIFEGANRLVQVLFKFVPLRTGVDELTTGSFTQMLGFGAALGTTLAIVRKIRTIVWVLVGTALLIRRSLASRREAECRRRALPQTTGRLTDAGSGTRSRSLTKLTKDLAERPSSRAVCGARPPAALPSPCAS